MSKIDFNKPPYNDDFDKTKNYLKVLFKAGKPVQSRELNQIQSILQNQIGVFADHIFKNGSKVSNCRTSIVYRNYVRLLDTFANTDDLVDIVSYDKKYRVIGEASGVQGTFIKGVNKTSSDPATMFVIYDQTGSYDGIEYTEFVHGETVSIVDENNVIIKRVIVRCPGCPNSGLSDEISPTGTSAFFAIDDGEMYYNNYFVHVVQQEIVLIKYIKYNADKIVINEDKFKVGLDFIESVVTSEEDPTLNDNALGYPNYSADGADRYHAELNLVIRDYSAEDGDNFILLAKIREGLQVEFVKADSEYSQINEEFARRTYEQAGNFTVTPFKTKFYEAKKQNANDSSGWSLTGDDNKLVAVVSPGIGYVNGYRHETKSDTVVTFDKARDTEKVNNSSQYLANRTYFIVDVKSKSHIVNPSSSQNIISANDLYLYDGEITGNDVTGSNIGYLKVIDQSVHNGTQYKLYVYSVTITKVGSTFSDVKSVKNTDGTFVASAVRNSSGLAALYDVNNISLIYPISQSNIKSLRDMENNSNGDTNIFVRKKLIGRTDSNGSVTFTAQTNESFLPFNPLDNYAYIGNANAPLDMVKLTSSNYITSGSTLTVTVNSSNVNTEIVVYANIQKVHQTENQKVVDVKTFTTTVQPSGIVGEYIPLGVADAFQIKSVLLVKDGEPPLDITSDYILRNGQTDMFYGESSLTRITTRNTISDHRLIVSVYYFKHSGTAGYFTVDSYSQLIDENNEWGLTYEDIPTYALSNGVVKKLSDVFDFRPIYIENKIQSDTLLPVQSTTVIFDVEYYLPRVDLLYLDADGNIGVKKGNASNNPVPPAPDSNMMGLYKIKLNPYTYSIKDVNTKFIENKRYTMRDIGRIESRVENLEYYQTLSLLEQTTANMSIKDSAGYDRYKNGFMVDSFNNLSTSDVLNSEYKAAVDTKRGELRPVSVATSTKLELDTANSVNVLAKGNMVMIPYDEEKFQENPYATKNISINPYMVYNKKGSLVISPNIDTWSDTEYLPDVNLDIDTGVDALKSVADAAGVLGTHYGSWASLNTTTQLTENLYTETTLTGESQWMTFDNGWHVGLGQNNITYSTTTGTTTETSTRTVTTNTIESRVNEYTISDVVKNVSIQPYVRSRIIEFYGSKLKPNRTVYAFFDGVDVTQYCRLIQNVIYDEMEIEKIRNQVIFGGIGLKTDANGEIIGEFLIPANTFFTGEKTFVITDDPKNTGNDDVTTTSASVVYFAGGINQSKQDTTLNVITPSFNSTTRTELRTLSQTTTSRDQTTTEIIKDLSTGDIILNETTVTDYTPPTTVVNEYKTWWNIDPVAQAFIVTEPCFITRLDLYFKQVDNTTNETVWVELRTMLNGYPTKTVLARKEYAPAQLALLASETSTTAFPVIFDTPVFVDANISYCFVVGGYSPDTRLWVSRLGEEVVNMNGKVVEEPPTPFSSFRSINGETWNAEQYENIKHGIYRAIFKSRKLTAVFRNNDEQEPLKLEYNPIEIQSGQTRVRIHAKNHGVNVTDRVSLSLFENVPFVVEVGNSTPPQISQVFTTPTGRGVVKSVALGSDANSYIITLVNVAGTFEADQRYNCAVRARKYNDTTLMQNNNNTVGDPIMLNESNGFVRTTPSSVIEINSIGSAPLDKFNYEHVVVEVDTPDSFIVEIAHSFNQNGRFGGGNGKAFDISRRYESFNISGAYLPYGANENFLLSPIKYNQNNTIDKDKQFYINLDHYMADSMKLLSRKNEVRVFGDAGRRSIKATLEFESKSSYLSPMINIDSFSMITMSNRVGLHNKIDVNVSPNATAQYVDEVDNGTTTYKYVTVKALLKDPAQELKLYLDVYKDINADFDVYVKPIEVHENNDESKVKWIKMDQIDKSQTSSNVDDKIEYEITASEATEWKEGLEYIAYRVKLVGTTSNAAKPPIFDNLRTIAVT